MARYLTIDGAEFLAINLIRYLPHARTITVHAGEIRERFAVDRALIATPSMEAVHLKTTVRPPLGGCEGRRSAR